MSNAGGTTHGLLNGRKTSESEKVWFHTLNEKTVRPEGDYFTGIGQTSDTKGLTALEKIDPIQDSLLKLITSKKKAHKPAKKTTSKLKDSDDEKQSSVVNIMDALKRSVQKELKSRKAG